ncbi:MAG: type II secretion system F family protein [Novosphingobium sp.]|nr:type II secretion system F family protein [Novosphingobium sp.]
MQVQLAVVRGSDAPSWLTVDAPSIDGARSIAEADGWSVLSARATRPSSFRSLNLRSRTSFDHRIFCAQLSVLLRAGLGVVEAIRALCDNACAGSGYEQLAALLAELEKGRTLGTALSAQPTSFPKLLASMVQSAERTSGLPDALERYGRYATQMDALKATVRSASVYPLFLLTLGAAVIAFLLLYVVPRFAGVYESVRGDLPWAAMVLLEWGRFARDHGSLIVVGMIAIGGAIALGVGSPMVRARALDMLSRAPAIGRLAREIALARLYRTLSVLLGAGLSLRAALNNSAGLFDAATDRALSQAVGLISEGQSPSVALDRVGLTTPLTRSLIASGEGGGQLARMLDEAAHFLELETSRSLERAMKIIEPSLMAGIGVAVGVIVVLMYLPIFELAGSLR